MKKLLVLLFALCALSVNQFSHANPLAYDEAANSAADIQTALAKAKAANGESTTSTLSGQVTSIAA